MASFDDFTNALDYPMYVVTASADGRPSGCLVGFASQCSINPPRFLVWLSKENHTTEVAARTDVLAVHLLGPDQQGLAALFGCLTADQGADKFASAPWQPGPGGAPVLCHVTAWFEGRIEQRFDGGDHVGHLLAPLESGGSASPARGQLTYSAVRNLEPGHPA
ncbi:flavin reductase family protein [Streptacidiphilus carbonis]|jgi:flavin reductase (DIM6/NTAB) family NADH-FMN oxidoreductase RutF|uniref:flavin reductase family protein n=1 Tax=Streptacidiphilus carbonis TaxID=105422 RepID=UPI0005A93ADF|nr:flavin reductase family protein [Streptacidiphilus carbonis]